VTAGFLVAVLGCLALAYVTEPLRRGPRRDLPHGTSAAGQAQERMRAALAAILDLESERDMGKLRGEEFRSLRAEYEAEALAALKEIDLLEKSGLAQDELEAEIAAARARLACPRCAAPRLGQDACPRCGAP
jgi:hypothetical protein